ncbi:MAG: hypothetical protein AB1744_02215 [Candidatus Zixiibacteriota bacterium]
MRNLLSVVFAVLLISAVAAVLAPNAVQADGPLTAPASWCQTFYNSSTCFIGSTQCVAIAINCWAENPDQWYIWQAQW